MDVADYKIRAKEKLSGLQKTSRLRAVVVVRGLNSANAVIL